NPVRANTGLRARAPRSASRDFVESWSAGCVDRGRTHRETSPMSVRLHSSFRVASLLAGICLIAGCSRSLLTAPAPPRAAQPGLESAYAPKPAPSPPSVLAAPGPGQPVPDSLIVWVPVISTMVLRDTATLVVGHRWSLQFQKGSLPDDAVVTI